MTREAAPIAVALTRITQSYRSSFERPAWCEDPTSCQDTGSFEDTASLLGISRKGLYLKRVRYGLEAPGETPEPLATV